MKDYGFGNYIRNLREKASSNATQKKAHLLCRCAFFWLKRDKRSKTEVKLKKRSTAFSVFMLFHNRKSWFSFLFHLSCKSKSN
jgi:hypothetical protein